MIFLDTAAFVTTSALTAIAAVGFGPAGPKWNVDAAPFGDESMASPDGGA